MTTTNETFPTNTDETYPHWISLRDFLGSDAETFLDLLQRHCDDSHVYGSDPAFMNQANAKVLRDLSDDVVLRDGSGPEGLVAFDPAGFTSDDLDTIFVRVEPEDHTDEVSESSATFANIRDVVLGLGDYPLICDETLFAIEEEAKTETWIDYGRDDFVRAIQGAYLEAKGLGSALDYSDVRIDPVDDDQTRADAIDAAWIELVHEAWPSGDSMIEDAPGTIWIRPEAVGATAKVLIQSLDSCEESHGIRVSASPEGLRGAVTRYARARAESEGSSMVYGTPTHSDAREEGEALAGLLSFVD